MPRVKTKGEKPLGVKETDRIAYKQGNIIWIVNPHHLRKMSGGGVAVQGQALEKVPLHKRIKIWMNATPVEQGNSLHRYQHAMKRVMASPVTEGMRIPELRARLFKAMRKARVDGNEIHDNSTQKFNQMLFNVRKQTEVGSIIQDFSDKTYSSAVNWLHKKLLKKRGRLGIKILPKKNTIRNWLEGITYLPQGYGSDTSGWRPKPVLELFSKKLKETRIKNLVADQDGPIGEHAIKHNARVVRAAHRAVALLCRTEGIKQGAFVKKGESEQLIQLPPLVQALVDAGVSIQEKTSFLPVEHLTELDLGVTVPDSVKNRRMDEDEEGVNVQAELVKVDLDDPILYDTFFV